MSSTWKTQFSKDDICHWCRADRSAHRRVDLSETNLRWVCPDGMVEPRGTDDDPWEPSAYQPWAPVAELFDSYA